MVDDPAASQAWSAADYVRNAGFVSTLGAPLIDALDPRAGERVLDLGCSDGELAAAIAGRGARVSGIDGRERWPWRFPTDAEWREALERHGFDVDACALVSRPTPLPTGIDGWLVTFADPFLGGLDEGGRRAVRERVAELLAPSLRDAAGRWTADYVRLRFVARLR